MRHRSHAARLAALGVGLALGACGEPEQSADRVTIGVLLP
jgi:hypothetical protein